MTEPRPPRPLGPTGRALWRRVTADVPDGMELTAVELEALRQAAQTLDTAADLEREGRRLGLVVKGSSGQASANPLLREARLQRQAAVGMLARVKLTPPAERTGRMNKRQRDRRRDQLAQARRARWPTADA